MKHVFLTLLIAATQIAYAQTLDHSDFHSMVMITNADSMNHYLSEKGYLKSNAVIDYRSENISSNPKMKDHTGSTWIFATDPSDASTAMSKIIRYQNPDGSFVNGSQIQLTFETTNRFIYASVVNRMIEHGFGGMQILPSSEKSEISLTGHGEEILLETISNKQPVTYRTHFRITGTRNPEPTMATAATMARAAYPRKRAAVASRTMPVGVKVSAKPATPRKRSVRTCCVY